MSGYLKYSLSMMAVFASLGLIAWLVYHRPDIEYAIFFAYAAVQFVTAVLETIERLIKYLGQ